uniref:C2H2-type domain-containing protein n=1 Tax=Spongospora subterranea TaxID=70186 RepID=A0A0H5QIG7_9EUKA|eukprot:CRZ01860.1 hypothetical protein [Spongospora subterranea]
MDVAIPAIVIRSSTKILIPRPTFVGFSPWKHQCKCHACNAHRPKPNFIPKSGAFITSNTPAKRFPCDLCGKSFLQTSNLITHKRTHTGERPYACPRCDKRFSQSSNLRRHLRVHTGEKPWECQMCVVFSCFADCSSIML